MVACFCLFQSVEVSKRDTQVDIGFDKVPTNFWYLVVSECIMLDGVYKKKPEIQGFKVIFVLR